MNKDEINNLVTLLVAVLGPFGVKVGISQSDLAALLPALAAVGWGVWSNWNMKKVHEDSVVVSAPSKVSK